jgi:homopolymeric O-antigen transport system ATP-binding protein
MSESVIRVEGLGKRYRIDQGVRHTALRNLIGDALRAPLRLFTGSSHGSNRHPSAESPTGNAAAGAGMLAAANGGSRFIWALRDVNFEVRQGEVVGLIGRNGAGKSTLLKILARITRPTEGHAEIHGRVGSLLEVGTGFHPELTGRENVYMSGAILGMRKAEIDRKFDEIVAFSEVERFLDTPLKHYSSGMQMRLAFAVAAHLEPEILFVDEVLAVGDAAFQKKCLGKMDDISKQGRTIIFVSHNITALRALCTRLIWLEAGQVKANGDLGAIINHYLQNHKEDNLESIWKDDRTAPGDDRVRLRSARVILPTDTTDPITVHTALRIEFTYWNYAPGTVLNVSMILNNLEEACVLTSVSDWESRPAGLVRHSVEIPGDFLNSGSYYVNLFIVKDASTVILYQKNVVAFEVIEAEAVGNWYGKTPGAVRPRLRWRSEAIGSGDLTVTAATNSVVPSSTLKL